MDINAVSQYIDCSDKQQYSKMELDKNISKVDNNTLSCHRDVIVNVTGAMKHRAV